MWIFETRAWTKGKGKCQNEWDAEGLCALAWKIIFFYFSSSKWFCFFYSSVVPVLLKLATSVTVRWSVQPAVNCNVRTRSRQNAFQWALKARTLWASYSWVAASPLCYSCALQDETNEIYNNPFSFHWARAKLLQLSCKGNPCQDILSR